MRRFCPYIWSGTAKGYRCPNCDCSDGPDSLATHAEKLNVLDLFSGVGGFSLGLERTGGFKTVAFCEIEEFPRKVLAKHWPEVSIYDDVRTLTAERLAADGIAVDVICGGFPCQDISFASHAGAGLSGKRSGLWREYERLISELRPSIVIVENVSALLSRGFGDVLASLAALGYDAEWHCIPASAVGAPHPRDRVWLVAHATEVLWQGQRGDQSRRLLSADGLLSFVYDQGRPHGFANWRAVEPGVARGAHGVPNRVDRLGCLSNAIVPEIAEMIGRAILAAQGIEAATADETGTGSAVGESPVANGDAPDTPDLSTPLPSGSIER